MTRKKRTELVRRLDALPNCVLVLKKLFPNALQREAFRLGRLSMVSQTALMMGPVDFYGKMRTLPMFPDGPGQVEVVGYVRQDLWPVVG
jgi:hypothetical protein